MKKIFIVGLWLAIWLTATPRTLKAAQSNPSALQLISKTTHIDMSVPTLQSKNEHNPSFNQVVNNFLESTFMRYKQDAPTEAQNALIYKSVLQGKKEVSSDFVINHQVYYHTVSKISILFNISYMYPGYAHPKNDIYSLTFDLDHNRVMNLSDLFEKNSPYLAKLAEYCSRNLTLRDKSKNKKGIFSIPGGAAPTPENYSAWNLSLEGLVITFPQSQVAARPFGAVKVVVPYQQLGIERPL